MQHDELQETQRKEKDVALQPESDVKRRPPFRARDSNQWQRPREHWTYGRGKHTRNQQQFEGRPSELELATSGNTNESKEHVNDWCPVKAAGDKTKIDTGDIIKGGTETPRAYAEYS